ncbi:MAG: phosphoribosyltransferase family protein [Spirochaetales bacterium]|nr:phosphoribosyltransferase family protein [Spirochaetales bacterium]
MNKTLVVGNYADSVFVADIAHHLGQKENYQDLIALKTFHNSEFCPRYIFGDREDKNMIGRRLEGQKVLIVSTSSPRMNRNELAMHNLLIARAARENGAERVSLLEPDLFFSAQDRGPRPEYGQTLFTRDSVDYEKFDGQPFSAKLYADLLREAGVNQVFTVHNHSPFSLRMLYQEHFDGMFVDLRPVDLYADYLKSSDIVNLDDLIICAPDKGAHEFATQLAEQFTEKPVGYLRMSKERRGEREVIVQPATCSPLQLGDIEGKDIVVVDDMVRTGRTILETCKVIRKAKPRKIIFLVTHFYSSREGRALLDDPVIDEIVTTNTIPAILNRDEQGRLRHKMVVLRISRWIAHNLFMNLQPESGGLKMPHFVEDISSKNPRWKGKYGAHH